MKRTFYYLTILGLLTSCGNHITKETAFVKLDKYEYQDNTNGDFSGGCKPGRTIKVSGTTNFPNGTIIAVQTSGFVASSRKGGMYDIEDEAKVQDGKFSVTLHPMNITEGIEFRIFSDKQSEDDVKDIIGEAGVYESESYKVNEDIISKIKESSPTVYKFQKPSELKKPYEKKLAEYVKCWKDKDWNSMAQHCQVLEGTNASKLKSIYDMSNLLGFEITSSNQGAELPSGNILMEVNFTLNFETTNEMNGIQKKNLKANVIQENGKWGVNSGSTLRGLYN
jgi:hypothetical protein